MIKGRRRKRKDIITTLVTTSIFFVGIAVITTLNPLPQQQQQQQQQQHQHQPDQIHLLDSDSLINETEVTPSNDGSVSRLDQQQQYQQQVHTLIDRKNNVVIRNNGTWTWTTVNGTVTIITLNNNPKNTITTSTNVGNNDILYNSDHNSTKTNNQSQNKLNLTAVIHIGPHKTGSTTLQQWYRSLLKELVQDGYDVPMNSLEQRRKQQQQQQQQQEAEEKNVADDRVDTGSTMNRSQTTTTTPSFKANMMEIARCYIDPTSKHYYPSNCKQEYINEIPMIARRGYNLLLSSENFVNPYVNLTKFIHEMIVPYYSTIKIVLYYRRFYEWVRSSYNEGAKYLNGTERLDSIQHYYERKYSIEFLQRLHEHLYITANVQRLQEMNYDLMTRYDDDHLDSNRTTNKINDCTISIELYNLHAIHGNEDVLRSFFCHAIPNATATCTGLNKRILKLKKRIEENNQATKELQQNSSALEKFMLRYKVGKQSNTTDSNPLFHEEIPSTSTRRRRRRKLYETIAENGGNNYFLDDSNDIADDADDEEDDDIANISLTYNSNIPLVYEDLVYAAVSRNWIPSDIILIHNNTGRKSYQRPSHRVSPLFVRAVNMVRYRHEYILHFNQYEFVSNNSDFIIMSSDINNINNNNTNSNEYKLSTPLQCPSPENLEYLLNETIQDENYLFPLPENVNDVGDNHNNNNEVTPTPTTNSSNITSREQRIRIHFEKSSTTSLCRIDAQTVLDNDPTWEVFFQTDVRNEINYCLQIALKQQQRLQEIQIKKQLKQQRLKELQIKKEMKQQRLKELQIKREMKQQRLKELQIKREIKQQQRLKQIQKKQQLELARAAKKKTKESKTTVRKVKAVNTTSPEWSRQRL